MCVGVAAACAAFVVPLAAQEAGAVVEPEPPVPGAVPLSLEQAVARATGESEEVLLARSQLDLADAQISATRAQALPQVSATAGYTRTLASAFDSGGGGFAVPDSLRFDPDPTLPLEERVAYLEDHVPTAGLGSLGNLFGDLPFGQANTYIAAINGSQLLYSGGRVGAAMDIARHYRDAAELNLAEEEAEIELQVRTAYYQALLAGEMEEIAVIALQQAEEFLVQERLRLSAGRASELEVLRAEVSRDNLRPQLVQARNSAELATLNLKRLVDIPLTIPITLTTPLAPPAAPAVAVPVDPETLTSERAAVLAAERQVDIREQQVRIARGAYLPSISFNMGYGKQLFPSTAFAFQEDWRTDWTAGLSVQIPIFNGGQRGAELAQARVELDRSRLQVAQLRESVQLQYEQARGERERAREAISARETTVTQAQRVYDLTVLRYEQGLATQLEVSQARLELLQARTNLAQAVTDFHIADAGLARATTVASDAPRN